MSVHLHLPLRVRVPAHLAPDAVDRVRSAVDRGVRRAVARARRQAIDPRGGEWTVRVHGSAARFVGAELVPERDLGALERSIAEGIASALSASGLHARSSPGRDAAARAEERTPSELLRRERLDLGAGSYRIPSYDDEGETVLLTVLGASESGDQAPDEAGKPWEELGNSRSLFLEAALQVAWTAHVERSGQRWDPATLGYPGYYGHVRVPDGSFHGLIWISAIKGLDDMGQPFGWSYRYMPLRRLVVPANSGSFRWVSMAAEEGHLLLATTARSASYESVLSEVEELERQFPEASRLPRREAREAYARALADENQVIFRLEGPSWRMFALLPAASMDTPIRFVTAAYHLRSPSAIGDGDADEAGGRDDRAGREGPGAKELAGGPLTDGESKEGSIWPARGASGEPLLCEPFLGEPSIDQLPVGSEALRADVERLARRLGVSYCGFAGKFCLNAADVISGRARSIGLASIDDGATTNVTLRPQGGGNNGIVDIQPSESPALEYMRVLAEIAAELGSLAEQVQRTYSRPENGALIFRDSEHEFGPNSVAWIRIFIVEFVERLTLGCMHLYAETCRVILLQQLRSSRRFINARAHDLETTKRDFDIALGILGRRIARLMLARRAIHGARLAASSVGPMGIFPAAHLFSIATGPARASDYVTGVRDLTSAAWQLDPGMLTEASKVSVDRRGEDFIAHLDGREWTEQDLDQAIQVHRGLLNSVDPLFNQVGDLEPLYRRFARAPESTREYLRDLLDEMSKANAELTSKSSNEDKGAFFALETSKYIEAEGGYSSRGLRYELRGIHGLADDQLRPRIGNLYEYDRGIERGIGFKAGFDQLISAFSFTGVIVLGVMCAPLGAVAAGAITGAAGLGLTAVDYYRAHKDEKTYRALEDPELILSWQDVQLGYLMAHLSGAFVMFDAIGVGKGMRAVVRDARIAMRTALREGVSETAREAVRARGKRIMKELAEGILDQAMRQALQGVVLQAVMERALSCVMEPLIAPFLTASGGDHGAGARLDALRAEVEDPAAGGAESVEGAAATENDAEGDRD